MSFPQQTWLSPYPEIHIFFHEHSIPGIWPGGNLTMLQMDNLFFWGLASSYWSFHAFCRRWLQTNRGRRRVGYLSTVDPSWSSFDHGFCYMSILNVPTSKGLPLCQPIRGKFQIRVFLLQPDMNTRIAMQKLGKHRWTIACSTAISATDS